MSPKVAAAAVALAFAGGVASHAVVVAPGEIRVHHVELTLRPQPDGGAEVEEVAFGMRDGKRTGESLSCVEPDSCIDCIQRAQRDCVWP